MVRGMAILLYTVGVVCRPWSPKGRLVICDAYLFQGIPGRIPKFTYKIEIFNPNVGINNLIYVWYLEKRECFLSGEKGTLYE